MTSIHKNLWSIVLSILASAMISFILLPKLSPAHAANRVALVIGNSSYQHTTKLINPVNDARDIKGVLKKLGFDVVGGTDFDRRGVVKAVREFARKLRKADVGLFYYSGHGLQVRGENYLVPVDAELKEESDLEFNLVEVESVLKCSIPCDYIPVNSYPLFRAREVLREIVTEARERRT